MHCCQIPPHADLQLSPGPWLGPDVSCDTKSVAPDEVLRLSPGGVYQLWKQHSGLRPDKAVGKTLFYEVYNDTFHKDISFSQTPAA